jgi:hypothetical protein
MYNSPIWDVNDYMEFGLGVIDGAFNALPTGSSAKYCSKNSTAARGYLN